MSKWDRVQSSFERAHDDLFQNDEYEATFYNYSGGSWDPDADAFTGESRSSFLTTQIEIVPPGMDTTVDVDGTSVSFDTSIRLPADDVSTDAFVPLGDDNEKPTEVVISDPQSAEDDLYELHGYSYEKGSDMLMCRLVEQ